MKHLEMAPPFAADKPWLAPLAGYSDLAFRLLCRENGAACACTEMISASGVVYSSEGTKKLLQTCAEDAPLVTQVFGAKSDIMAQAMDWLLEEGFRWYDLNAGCPVPKVVKTGSGSGMLRDEQSVDNLVDVAASMVRAAGKGRVGVKFRLGWFMHKPVFIEVAQRLEDLGVGWLTLHPRYGKQGFAGEADWNALGELKRNVSIPVLGSGDLFTPEDGVKCVRSSGIDGVMYARGAMSDPAIFQKHARLYVEGHNPETPLPVEDYAEHKAIMHRVRRHVELARAYGPPHGNFLKMRFFAPKYIRHLPGARSLRKKLTQCINWEEMEELLQNFFSELST